MKKLIPAIALTLLSTTAFAASQSEREMTRDLNRYQSERVAPTTVYYGSDANYYIWDRPSVSRHEWRAADARRDHGNPAGFKGEAGEARYYRNDNPGEPRSARGSESSYNAPSKYGRSIGDKDVYRADTNDADYRYNRYDRYEPAAGYYDRDYDRYDRYNR